MRHFETTSYQTETPVLLWEPWKNGPGAEPDRYSTRISRLLAFDLLLCDADRLEEQERELAEELIADSELEGLLDGV